MDSHGRPSLLLFLQLLLLPSIMAASVNPFSPKASLLRHWSRIFPTVDIPTILLAKSSPLNATQLATFSSYLDSHTLRSHLPAFCSAADLFCDLKAPANITHDLNTDANFESYNNNQFKRYQVGGVSDGDSFKNYSVDQNVAQDTFLRYGKDGTSQIESFGNYELNGNVGASRFGNYDDASNGGIATFSSYSDQGNVQDQDFKAYGRGSNGANHGFTSYSENSNVVKNGFTSYLDDANGALTTFNSYSTSSNVITNKFNSYDNAGNGALSFFTSYAESSNVGLNDFKKYGGEGNGGDEQFSSYAGSAENSFTTYSRGGHEPDETFNNYGNESFSSEPSFSEYNKDASGLPQVTFTTYGGNVNASSFKQYFDSNTNFNDYRNTSSEAAAKPAVESGKFFRQATLVAGNHIPFPDVRDKMPKRAFLPRSLAEKLPLSSAKLPELVQVFGAGNMKTMMAHTLSECERPAVKDETKRCVNSLEGMADFASSVLGETATVSATESTVGWGQKLVVGKVIGRNNGKETRSVSCHQSLFPYLVYYCHMVPRVTVYDVELLASGEGAKPQTNQAVAICHQDTTQWSPKHAAFAALGPAPGKIEVCHFIFENDFIWVARE